MGVGAEWVWKKYYPHILFTRFGMLAAWKGGGMVYSQILQSLQSLQSLEGSQKRGGVLINVFNAPLLNKRHQSSP